MPLQVFWFASKVEDAAVMVMSAVPLNAVPLMLREFWSAVAVPALPEMEPVMVEEKVFEPLKVLLFARSVLEAAVIVIGEAPGKETELMVVPGERAEAVATLVEVATNASPPLDQPRTWPLVPTP